MGYLQLSRTQYMKKKSDKICVQCKLYHKNLEIKEFINEIEWNGFQCNDCDSKAENFEYEYEYPVIKVLKIIYVVSETISIHV